MNKRTSSEGEESKRRCLGRHDMPQNLYDIVEIKAEMENEVLTVIRWRTKGRMSSTFIVDGIVY